METAKLPKFQWGRIDEQNSGHTQNEWGTRKPDNKIVVVYDLVWNSKKA